MQSTRRTPNASLTNVPSFRPELEFEIIKSVLLRESYLKRLEKTLKGNGGKVDITVVGIVDVLRECSIEIVDIIQTWERTQFDYPTDVKPFLWNGINYLQKMCSDNSSISQFPQVEDWLGFSPECNPFFIPPEALEGTVAIASNAFVVFGFRPPPPPQAPRTKVNMPKFVKSPYLTPIHNDLDIFPQNSAINKAKSKDKLRAGLQSAADAKQAVGKDRAKDAVTDPYQCFLHADNILRAKKMLSVLIKNNGNQTLFATSIAYSPSSSFVTATEYNAPNPVAHPPGPGSPMKSKSSISAGGSGVTSSLPPVPTQTETALGSNLEDGSLDILPIVQSGSIIDGSGQASQVQFDGSVITAGEDEDGNRNAIRRPQRDGALPTRTNQPSASSPVKQSLSTTVGHTGSFAGRLGSTSIFSQNRGDFASTQDGFRQSLVDSATDEPLHNKTMRMEPVVDLSQTTKMSAMAFTSALDSASTTTMSGTQNASQIWTPHEIVLQRAVRRRGGELFVLTAAGTKGRIKAPTRRTRFERLLKDITQFDKQSLDIETKIETDRAALEEFRADIASNPKPSKRMQKKFNAQEEALNNLIESKRGIESWKHTLKDQNDNYKLVSELDPADLAKQRKMHNTLTDGQALEEDEKLSMGLEDRMAGRITRFIQRALRRQLAAALLIRQNLAACVIQNLVRRKANEGLAYERGIRLALAIKVQKLFRGAGGKGAAKSMGREQARRRAGFLLTRISRGCIARQRTRRKKLFLQSVAEAQQDVSLNCLNPEHIDTLADLLESYNKDYTISIPIQVMTVLRALFYMMIGEGEEVVTVDNAGYVEHVSLQADNIGWNGFRLVLRRKGRFLRRLRAMVQFISLPGPRALEFTPNAVIQMKCVADSIKSSHLEQIDRRNRETMLHLYDFVIHIYTAYKFQSEFPEYFVPGQPNWFRIMLRYQRAYQDAMAEVSMYKYCKKQIDDMRDEFKKTGKAWKPVKLASDTNEEDIAGAEERAKVALAMYDLEVKNFIKEETNTISLIRGFMQTREIGVNVAERDWAAFIEKEGDDAPEWRINRQRLVVDKAHLNLLDSKNQLFFAEKASIRDEKARDFKRVLRLQESRKICKEEGKLLGKLMVLQYVWEDFVLSIGGIQYIYDLTGEKKEYYEVTRKEVTAALKERRRLKICRDEEMSKQFQIAAEVAHQARMGEYTATWDIQTDMEAEAETQEDHDCRLRDADQDAKIARATKRLKIPPAEFKPLMLLIDIRVPKKIKAIIKQRLEPLHFQEVTGKLDDPTLTLKLQKLMDTRWNIFVFADRGTTLQARTAFLGYFRSLVYSLIPRPRIVALDAFLDLRYDNWFLDTAASQKDIFENNTCNSTEASLLLSRLRKTALVFKQCLIFETKQEEIDAGCTAILPDWLRSIFREDLDDFMNELEGGADHGGSVMSHGTEMNNAGMILAATISATLGWWNAPLLKWKERQIRDGCAAFMERVVDATHMCEMLWMKKFPRAQIKQLECLKQARSFTHVWAKITKCNFYKQPARYLLSRWAIEAMDLVEGITWQGGGADENFDNCGVSFARNLRWKDDLADPETCANQLVGELLHECLSESLIYECHDAIVSEYRPTTDVEDVERQFFAATSTPRTVRVYHSGTRAFVGVAIPGMPGENPVWQYFNQMDIIDIVSMLQPNGTELYEGTAERKDISDEGNDHWWELLAQWARMDVIGNTRSLELLRARYLMLTKVGTVSGHLCRFELFEERYAEILILVHGLPVSSGTVYFRVNKECINHLLEYCDKHEEKQAIQQREPLPIAYIFSDRIQAKPSVNQMWWLENGELDPKNLNFKRPLTVSLRVKGGPGRFVGRKMFTFSQMTFVISVFEISNPSDIQSLRLIIYDTKHCQTIEIRLSEMERVSIFNDDSTMIEQILGRLRTVFTDISVNRPLLLLEEDYIMPSNTYSVEGDQEYLLLDDQQLEWSREHAGSDDEMGKSVTIADSISKGDGSTLDDDSQMLELIAQEKEEADEQARIKAKAALDAKAKPWYWCMYFSRTVLDICIGNLTISAGLNVTLQGFDIYVIDNRTLYEKYTFLSFAKGIPYFYKTTIEDFRRRLRTINETTVFEIIDELFSVIEVNPSENDDGVNVFIVGLVSDNDTIPVYPLAYVRELEEDDMSEEGRKVNFKTAKVELQKVEIYVLAARDLSLVSGLEARNPTAIIKWNMREISKTIAPRNDCNPDWDEPGIRTSTTSNKPLKDCSLEIEIWDYNYQKARVTEFLGMVKLRGAALSELFENGGKKQLITMPLGRSNRLNDKENSMVQGSIVLFGLHEEHFGKITPPQTYRIVVDEEDKAAFEASLLKDQKEFEKSQNPRSGWGWGSKTPEKSTTPAAAPDIRASEASPGGASAITTATSWDPNKTVPFSFVDRSIRFSMRHKQVRHDAILAHAAGTGVGDTVIMKAIQNAANNKKRDHSAQSTHHSSAGGALGVSDSPLESIADRIVNHFPDIEELGDDALDEANNMLQLQNDKNNKNIENDDENQSVGQSMLSELAGDSFAEGDEHFPNGDDGIDTARSKAFTDDTFTMAGGSARGNIEDDEEYVPLMITVKLLQLEGIPHETKYVTAVMKFNGFEAGRSGDVPCMKTIMELEDGSMEVAMGDDRYRQDIINKLAWDEAKALENEGKSVSTAASRRADRALRKKNEEKAEKRKAKRAANIAAGRDSDDDGDDADDDSDEENDEQTMDTTLGDSSLSMSKAKNNVVEVKDDDSFISFDRQAPIEEASIDNTVRTYLIPDRIRRSDVNNIAIFPNGTTFDMTVPDFLDIYSCSIEMELWDADTLELLGVIDMRGTKLKTFIQEQGLAKQWLMFYDTYSGNASEFENSCGDMIPLRMMVNATDNTIPDDPDFIPPRFKLLALQFKQIKFIPADFIPIIEEEEEEEVEDADLISYDSRVEEWKGKIIEDTGIYTEIVWNGEVVYTTRILHGAKEGQLSLEFAETEEWNFTLDKDTDIKDCRLELKTYSQDGRIFHEAHHPHRDHLQKMEDSFVTKSQSQSQSQMKKSGDISDDDDDDNGKGSKKVSESKSESKTITLHESKGTLDSKANSIVAGSKDAKLGDEVKEMQDEEEELDEEGMAALAEREAENLRKATRLLGVRLITGEELDKLFQLLPEDVPEENNESKVEELNEESEAMTIIEQTSSTEIIKEMSVVKSKSLDMFEQPAAGCLLFPLDLKSRILPAEEPEPDQDEDPEEWTRWKMYTKLRLLENAKPRTCEIDIFSRELVPPDGPPPPEPVTIIAGWGSHGGIPGVSPPQSANKNKPFSNRGGSAGGLPGFLTIGRPGTGGAGSTGRPGSTGLGGLRPGSSGINMAVSPALFQGGLTIDGFNFDGARVEMFRQNAMSEAQDMPRRKIILTLTSIVVIGSKPRPEGVGWGWGGEVAPPKVEKKIESVPLALSQGRAQQGISFLKRYIDCANFIGNKNISQLQQYEDDFNEEERQRLDLIENPLKPQYAPGVKFKPRNNTERHRNTLSSRSGSVLIMQRKATFISKKRARINAAPVISCIEEEGSGIDGENKNKADSKDEADGKNFENKEESRPSSKGGENKRQRSDSNSTGPGVEVVHVDEKDEDKGLDQKDSMNLTEEKEEEKEVEPAPEIIMDNFAFREVQIFFNGAFVHEMLVPIKYTIQHGNEEEEIPNFDHDDLKIPLFVPRGQRLDACRLEIVIFSITPQGKKDRVIGVRVFESQELLNLFDHQDRPISPAPFATQAEDEFEGANSPIREVLIKPQAGETLVYDMEVPGTYNGGNTEGIALATERVELCGAAEIDYEDVTSGLNLGVRGHSRQRNIQSREQGLQASRRKVEIRLLAAKGLITSHRRGQAGHLTDKQEMTLHALREQDMYAQDEKDRALDGGDEEGSLAASLDNSIEDGIFDEMSAIMGATGGHLDSPSNDIIKTKSAGGAGLNSIGITHATHDVISPTYVASKDASKVGGAMGHIGPEASLDESVETDPFRATLEANDIQEVYAIVRWNGQEIRQSHPMPISNCVVWADGNPRHDWANLTQEQQKALEEDRQRLHPSAPIVDAIASSTYTMYVPVGHRLRGCYLEVAVMQGDLCLGSTFLHGEDLESFLQGFGSVTEDPAFYEDYDVNDEVATSMRSYPLQYSPGIPRSVQPTQLNGRLVLRGRVESETNEEYRRPQTTTNPFAVQQHKQFHGVVNIKKKTHDVSMFKIKTKFHKDMIGWRFFHDQLTSDEAEEADKKAAYEKKRITALQSIEQRSSLLMSSTSRETPVLSIENGESYAESGISGKYEQQSNTSDTNEDQSKNVSIVVVEIPFPDMRTGINIPKPFKLPMKKFALELSAVKYLVVNEELQEDCRICWRGRAMPKNFKGKKGDDVTESMMMSRASRLVRTKKLNEIKLLADVHFLKDLGNAKQTTLNALPISVKEIVSAGPGLCSRIYRIDISTNSGQPIGQADINTDLDMIRSVGVKNAFLFGDNGRKGWKMPELFAFIVNDRCQIDFMPTEKNKNLNAEKKKNAKEVNRRGGMSAGQTGQVKAPTSVINIIMDEIVPSDVRFRALYGSQGFQRDEKAYEDVEMKQEMLRIASIANTAAMDKAFQKAIAGTSAALDFENQNSAGGAGGYSDGIIETKKIEEEEQGEGSDDDWSVSDSQESESDESTIDAEEERRKNIPVQFLRIFSTTHRMSGIQFKTIIMLTGRIENLFTDPNEWFFNKTLKEGLSDVTVLFRSKDTFTKITYELEFQGIEIIGWMSQIKTNLKDLSSKFRRSKFGEFLLKNLIMRFGRKQEFILDLVNEEIGQLTADVEANDGNDIMGINVQGAEGQDTMGARAIARAEQAAEKLRLKKQRRVEKILKIRAAEAEKKADEEARKKEIEDKKANENRSKAGAAGAAAADAMAAAGNAAKAAFGKLKFW